MRFSVEVPDALAQQLHLDGADGERRALEIFAVEGYRRGELSRGQISELLGLEFNETEGLLKAHHAFIPLSREEFARSSKGLEGLLSR
jgi:predicted HTH domain antitoxin